MNTNYLQAADDALRLLKGFAAIKEVADAFAEVGQLQQAATEAQAVLDTIKPQLAQAIADRDEALAAIAPAKEQAKAILADAKDNAAALIADAQAKAQDVKAQADVYCAEVVAAASAKVTEADEALAAKRAELAAMAQEASDIEARIERAKSKMQELLGA